VTPIATLPEDVEVVEEAEEGASEAVPGDLVMGEDEMVVVVACVINTNKATALSVTHAASRTKVVVAVEEEVEVEEYASPTKKVSVTGVTHAVFRTRVVVEDEEEVEEELAYATLTRKVSVTGVTHAVFLTRVEVEDGEEQAVEVVACVMPTRKVSAPEVTHVAFRTRRVEVEEVVVVVPVKVYVSTLPEACATAEITVGSRTKKEVEVEEEFAMHIRVVDALEEIHVDTSTI